MKLTVATFFGDRLNLNGDQANLAVLQRRAFGYGVELSVQSATTADEARAADLVFVGHGSIAAWRSVEAKFEAFMAGIQTNQLVFAIGSGAERVAVRQGITLLRGLRQSIFTTHRLESQAGEFELVGYLNTDVTNLASQWKVNTILSMLHGPVLSKNPELADAILTAMVVARGGVLGEKPDDLVRLDELAAAARRDAGR